MSSTFVVRNQLGQYWGKKKKWVDGTDPKRVLVCKHEDEGVNLLVELSARNIDLRGEVTPTELNDRGIPQVEPSEHLIADEPAPMKLETAGEEQQEPSAADTVEEDSEADAEENQSE